MLRDVIPDSIAYPLRSDSKYLGTHPTANREFMDGKPFIETFVPDCSIGRSHDEVAVQLLSSSPPIRPPASVQWQQAISAALIGNRVGLGAGTSPRPEDYELMASCFQARRDLVDECIEIVRGLPPAIT